MYVSAKILEFKRKEKQKQHIKCVFQLLTERERERAKATATAKAKYERPLLINSADHKQRCPSTALLTANTAAKTTVL